MYTKYQQNNHGRSYGFALVEVLVACAIISTSVFAIMSASAKGVELSSRALQYGQASYLLEEGAEAVKTMRDAAWSNISSLTVGTTYYLSYSTSTNLWSLSTTSSTIDAFTRTVVFSAVSRDSNDDITTSGGTIDTRTKKVTVTVSWATASGNLSKTLDFYLVDIFT